MSEPPKASLPSHPQLNWLKDRAKEKLASLRAVNAKAKLSEAQLAIAREYGFPSWRALKAKVDALRAAAPTPTAGEAAPAAQVASDRHVIEGVPVLSWDKSGATTFCGSLSAALAVTDRATDYATLMGDTGLALRLRWYRADDPAEPRGWCNSSPVGEFSPWTNLASNSMGWRMRWETHIMGFNAGERMDMRRFVGDVVASIDAGVPVLCYPPQTDTGVIYGYEDTGQTLLVRNYYEGSREYRLPLQDVNGMLAFLTQKTARPSRHEAVLAGLRQVVEDFSRQPTRADRDGRRGAYRFGAHAYQTWLADLAGADEMTPQHQANLFRAGWWTFNVLTDARYAAEKYLNGAAEVFNGTARAALLQAAAACRAASAKTVSVFRNKDAFFGPWSGKRIEDWTPAVRTREIELLTAARAGDEQAVREIKTVLAAERIHTD